MCLRCKFLGLISGLSHCSIVLFYFEQIARLFRSKGAANTCFSHSYFDMYHTLLLTKALFEVVAVAKTLGAHGIAHVASHRVLAFFLEPCIARVQRLGAFVYV